MRRRLLGLLPFSVVQGCPPLKPLILRPGIRFIPLFREEGEERKGRNWVYFRIGALLQCSTLFHSRFYFGRAAIRFSGARLSPFSPKKSKNRAPLQSISLTLNQAEPSRAVITQFGGAWALKMELSLN